MPELPEVETVVRGLNRSVRGRKIVDIWTDRPKYFSKGGLAKTKKQFKKCVVGEKIKKAERRGKNILITLTNDKLLLVHQKMTGHFLYGKWKIKSETPEGWEKEKWIPDPPTKFLTDPKNKFIRLIFFLNNGKMLALSDMRRFAKIICGEREEVLKSKDISILGPEPLKITEKKFIDLFNHKKGRVKQVLMDQSFIVGIGNIYSDEILYLSKIHPLSRVEKLNKKQLIILYKNIKKVLNKAVKRKGTSTDDFRDIKGRKGDYASELLVYQKHKEKCPKGHEIKRIKVGGRSAHFCLKEQKFY